MGFYYNNGAIRDTIDANFLAELNPDIKTPEGNVQFNDGDVIEADISIENNEIIKFDFSKITFKEKFLGTRFFKASVEFGDGNKKLISEFITERYSVINSTWDDWTSITHNYNFQTAEKSKLIITFYSSAGDTAKVILNFDIKFKSIYELGTEFELISANINAKNSTSYLFRHAASDSIIMATKK